MSRPTERFVRDHKGISLKLVGSFWLYWYRSTGSVGLWRGARLVKTLTRGRS